MSSDNNNTALGHWLIAIMEPDEMDELASMPNLQIFGIAVMAWLADEISRTLDLTSKSISLEVTWAEYYGKYPCLGVRRLQSEVVVPDELESQIQTEVSKLVRTRSVLDLLRFIATHQTVIDDLRRAEPGQARSRNC